MAKRPEASETTKSRPARVEPLAPTAGGDPATDDDALLDGLRRLRPDAYEVLLDRFEAPLYRFFYYSHGDHDLAEDQCGDTFAQAIVAVHKMRGDAGALRAFVFGIARNVLRRSWRRRQPRALGEIELNLLADRQPSVFRQVADREAWERTIGAIEQFSEPTRQVVLLRFVEQLTLDEIAESLEMPLGSVKSAIHRARKRLKFLRSESA